MILQLIRICSMQACITKDHVNVNTPDDNTGGLANIMI